MFIQLSIVDKHGKPGERHVGTYTFEVDLPESHYEIIVVYGNLTGNDAVLQRRCLNKMMSRDEMVRAGIVPTRLDA